MVLKTKCVLAAVSFDDGLRISVMRTYDQKEHPEYKDVDQMWSDLGPSHGLVNKMYER